MMTGSNNSSQQAELELYWLLIFFSKTEAVEGFIAADVIAVKNAARNLGVKEHLSAGLDKSAMFGPSSHSLTFRMLWSCFAVKQNGQIGRDLEVFGLVEGGIHIRGLEWDEL